MQNEEYIEELIILSILGSVLLISKILGCCYSLGLYQKHKEIKLRTDSLSRAKIDCLQSERISQDISALKEIVCTCKGSPVIPAFPKTEPCSPASNIPQIPAKHLVTVTFKETTDWKYKIPESTRFINSCLITVMTYHFRDIHHLILTFADTIWYLVSNNCSLNWNSWQSKPTRVHIVLRGFSACLVHD